MAPDGPGYCRRAGEAMTAQFSDIVTYEGEDYDLAGIGGSGLFDPAEHGMEPTSWCTACWRGYVAAYRVEDDTLLLDSLSVCLTEPGMAREPGVRKVQAPAVGGTAPEDISGQQRSVFEYRYENMHLPVPFTGGLMLATDFIDELYVHMGFQSVWKYREVRELVFEEGRLTGSSDVSEKMAELRSKVKTMDLEPGLEASHEDVLTWIAECFSRDYRL